MHRATIQYKENLTYHGIVGCEVGFHVRPHGNKRSLVPHLVTASNKKTVGIHVQPLSPYVAFSVNA